jgi:hypothetical protein
MRKSAIAAAMVNLRLLALLFTTALVGPGCAGVGQHVSNWYYGLALHAQRHHELADIRAAEREVEQARLDAERRTLEMEFCRANQEALQRRMKSNIRETVESKVAFNVEQGLEVGELEVDVEELQALLKRRQEQPPPPELPLRKQPCPCCDAPCGCEPGMIRRFCPHCRHKPCEAEQTCGGPEALARIGELPLKRPLRPAEIPMKLPVRLNFGFQQPQMEQALVRRVPNVELPLERPPCNRCAEPNCPYPCTQPVAPVPPAAELNPTYQDQQPVRTGAPTVDPQIGPAPIPEAEANRLKWPTTWFMSRR